MDSVLGGKLLTYDFGGALVFISVNREIKRNSNDVNEDVFHAGRAQEDADTKIIVHTKHCLLNHHRNILVKTINIDVITMLTMLLGHLSLLDSPYEIEVNFKFGKNRKFFNDACPNITPEQQLAFMFFLTFTGCGNTSSLFDISKNTWRNVWYLNVYILKLC